MCVITDFIKAFILYLLDDLAVHLIESDLSDEMANYQIPEGTLKTGVPSAVFHGLGDFCLRPADQQFDKTIAEGTNGYVKCIEVGLPSLGEILNNFEYVAQKSCEKVAEDENFHGEFNVIGLSQGSLLARYIVEQCEMPGKAVKLVTLGGPHMGVDRIPHCWDYDKWLCKFSNQVIKALVYLPFVQDHVSPAGYFRDVLQIDKYEQSSVFLPPLNNDVGAN